MRIRYLLSGPDLAKGFGGQIVEYLKNDLKTARSICFIASTPSNFEKSDKYFDIWRNVFKKSGIVFKSAKLIDNRQVSRDFVGVDAVFLMGGDPIAQMQYLKDTGLDDCLLKFDGIIIGVSAGAINMCKKAYCSKDEDYPKSFVYDGLGLVGVTIDPHFNPDDSSQVAEFMEFGKELQLIGLPDSSSVRIDNKPVFIGEYYTVNKSKLVCNGYVRK